jgi:hypothetical protein
VPIDPTNRLALQRAVALSASVEAQLSQTRGGQPLVAVLMKAREEAIGAIAALIDADPDDAKAVRSLQTVAQRFRDLCHWLAVIVQEGKEADSDISEDEREELLAAVAGDPDAEYLAQQLGMIDPGDSTHGPQ